MIPQEQFQQSQNSQYINQEDKQMRRLGIQQCHSLRNNVSELQKIVGKMQKFQQIKESLAGNVQFTVQQIGPFLLCQIKKLWDQKVVFQKDTFLSLNLIRPKLSPQQISRFLRSRPSIVINIQGYQFPKIQPGVILQMKDGVYYEGNAQDMLIFKKDDITKYTGQVDMNTHSVPVYHGYGQLKYKFTTAQVSMYSGPFKDGKKQGSNGTQRTMDVLYHGQWKDNKKEGYGQEYVLAKKKKKKTKQIPKVMQDNVTQMSVSMDKSSEEKSEKLTNINNEKNLGPKQQEQVVNKEQASISQTQEQKKQDKKQNQNSKVQEKQKNTQTLSQVDKSQQIHTKLQTKLQQNIGNSASDFAKKQEPFQSQSSIAEQEQKKKEKAKWKHYKSIYKGKFSNDMRCGHGNEQTKTSIYQGQWNRGVKEGEGTIQYTNGQMYTGNWKNNYFCGQGVYRHKNGDVYDGEFDEGYRHGTGTMKYSNGDQYQGEWQFDLRHGKGIYKYDGQQDYYDGEWVNGKAEGEGISMINGVYFQGTFKKGKRHGRGQLIDQNGDTILGVWKNNQNIQTISKNGQVVDE